MKTEIKKELGICGLSIALNVHEINVLNDAKTALEKGIELRKASKDADDEYTRIRWDKQVLDATKEEAKKKSNEAQKTLDDNQPNEMKAIETFFGFISKFLENYPATEKCGFEPRKFII